MEKKSVTRIMKVFTLSAVILLNMPYNLRGQFVNEKTIVKPSSINPILQDPFDKKLIYSSNSLHWSLVNDNIKKMEAMHPEIDGIAGAMNGGDFAKYYRIFRGDKKWTDTDVQLDIVSQIEWGKFKDNFIILCLTDSVDFEFFNDSKWSIILHNTRMVSKMLNAGRFKGVMLDNENYFEKMGSFPWKFNQDKYSGYSLEQVKTKCRERGKEFMKALQSNVSYPIVILNFFWFGDSWSNYDKPDNREALWMPFMDGMLESSNPDILFVEGNEIAYWFTDTEMFTDIYNEFRNVRFPKYGAKDLQNKYKNQVQVGHGIYPSLYYDKFERWPHKYPEELHGTWWKHQLYNALLTSDKYVWIWSERWNWWEDGTGTMELPPDFVPIIKDVKDKLRNQGNLDFDMIDQRPVWKENLVSPSGKWGIAEFPKITITSPKNNAKIRGNITIETKTSGDASKVEFFVNSMRVGIDSTAPYSIKVSGLQKGVYSIFARAFDTKKEHNTSAPIVVTVKGK